MGGINENVAVLLLVAPHGVPVTPHACGVGLCETGQHLARFDRVTLRTPMEGGWIECVEPGTGACVLPQSLANHASPGGLVWQEPA